MSALNFRSKRGVWYPAIQISESDLAISVAYWISAFETSICRDARFIVGAFLGLTCSDKSPFPNMTIAIKPASERTDTRIGRE